LTSKLEFIARAGIAALRKPRVDRRVQEVLTEYTSGWESFRLQLATAATLDDWLTIEGFDVREDWFNVDDRLAFQRFSSSNFYRTMLKRVFDAHFTGAKSVTEYGCGLGRNLLFLKRLYPDLRCYGYELVPEGVEIARLAAQKFGLSVEYAQLDYARDPPERFAFPETDVAITVFSLEQLPADCAAALHNMLMRARLGSIHLEPVTENYPFSVRGIIGRIDHKKAGYLRGFPKAVDAQALRRVWHERMTSSHNALMFPSVYVLTK
jgi:hypothetical protein